MSDPNIESCIEEARAKLHEAKREPGHSPTEDALLDAIEAVLDATDMLVRYLEKTS